MGTRGKSVVETVRSGCVHIEELECWQILLLFAGGAGGENVMLLVDGWLGLALYMTDRLKRRTGGASRIIEP